MKHKAKSLLRELGILISRTYDVDVSLGENSLEINIKNPHETTIVVIVYIQDSDEYSFLYWDKNLYNRDGDMTPPEPRPSFTAKFNTLKSGLHTFKVFLDEVSRLQIEHSVSTYNSVKNIANLKNTPYGRCCKARFEKIATFYDNLTKGKVKYYDIYGNKIQRS